jgi:hypothetical protein
VRLGPTLLRHPGTTVRRFSGEGPYAPMPRAVNSCAPRRQVRPEERISFVSDLAPARDATGRFRSCVPAGTAAPRSSSRASTYRGFLRSRGPARRCATGATSGRACSRRRSRGPIAISPRPAEAPFRRGVTNHTCRRTFASLLYEAGASPTYVMAQLGHTSSALALEVYAKKMERQRDTGARMDALIRAADWAQAGTNSTVVVDSLPVASTAGRS